MPTDSDQTPLLKQLIVTPPKNHSACAAAFCGS
jgi:hypothetical protein